VCAAKGFFGSFLDGITGNKVITEADLVAPLRKYQVSEAKNVGMLSIKISACCESPFF
jgi:hypothetical protein